MRPFRFLALCSNCGYWTGASCTYLNVRWTTICDCCKERGAIERYVDQETERVVEA